MIEQSIEYNKSQNREFRIACSRCHGKTRHKVLISVDVSGEDREWGIWYDEHYQILQCQGCEDIAFRKSHTNSEAAVMDEKGDLIQDVKEEIYPSRVAGRHKLSHIHFLPSIVCGIYEETHSALCNKQPVLAGIGIRALIETICKDKKADGANLEKKIDGLVGLGVLTGDGAKILHSLRILGNQAAHEVTPQSEDTLGIAFDVVEHLLNGVYVLPKVAQKLPKR